MSYAAQPLTLGQNFARRLGAASLCLALVSASDDPVIAQRGRDRLTLSQARALLAATPAEAREKLLSDPAKLQNLLRDALVQRAILAEAQSQNWERRPEVAAALRHDHDVIVSQSFLASKAPVPQAYPSDSDIEAAYERNKARFMQPRRYHLLQIFIDKPATGKDALALTAVRGKLAAGTLPFAASAIAGTQAHFTDMGWVAETQLAPEAKAAVAGLQEGAVSDQICIGNTCHLIKLVATKPAGPAALAEMRDALIQALRQAKQREEEQAYASSLLAKTPVMINEKLLPRMEP